MQAAEVTLDAITYCSLMSGVATAGQRKKAKDVLRVRIRFL